MSNILPIVAFVACTSAALLLPVPGCSSHAAKGDPSALEESALTAADGGGLARDQIVISQVYAGGGLPGAKRDHDFVELLNRTKNAIAIDGLSLQYADATSNFGSGDAGATIVPLTGTIGPGQYLLIALASGQPGQGDPLPTPELNGSVDLDSTAGKVALAKKTEPLGCGGLGAHCPTSMVIDLVGYGAVSEYEGTASVMPALDVGTAAIRKGEGCTDNDDNGADFTVAAPTPRNSSNPAADCSTSPPAKEAGTVPPVVDPPLGADQGGPDGGAKADAGAPPGGGSSSGCAVSHAGPPRLPWAALALAVLVPLRRRRRRCR
jgi:MYXO-CTERM domain-containing protein